MWNDIVTYLWKAGIITAAATAIWNYFKGSKNTRIKWFKENAEYIWSVVESHDQQRVRDGKPKMTGEEKATEFVNEFMHYAWMMGQPKIKDTEKRVIRELARVISKAKKVILPSK